MTGTQADPTPRRAGQQAAGRRSHPVTAAIQSALDSHRELVRNVLTLLATTGVSLALGFAYWNVAARLFSQETVGYGSAAISAMTFLSSFGTFGLNTLLVGELPRRTQRSGLIAAAMLAAALGATVVALAFVAIAPHVTTHYDDVVGSAGRAGVFCCGVALSAASVVFDAATIGMLRGGLQLARNLAFVMTKLVTLVTVAIGLGYTTGMGIFASWVAALAISLVIVAVRLWLGGRSRIVPRPDWSILKSLLRSLFAHNWLNFALQMPALVVPVVAASILPPATNAAYYIAITVAGGLFILPAHMSTVLFALGAKDPRALPGRLRFALRVSVAVALAGTATLGLGAHVILGIFGAGYARTAAVPMQLTAIACLPAIPNSFYIAVARATNNLCRAAALVTSFTVVEVGAVVVGAVKGGVVGMCAAELAAMAAEAVVTTPIVLRAARGRERHGRAASAAATSYTRGDAQRQPQRPAPSRRLALLSANVSVCSWVTAPVSPSTRGPRSPGVPLRAGGRGGYR